MSTEEKITEIEEEIRKTPYNKATESHIGRLKAKIAKLKREQIERQLSSGGRGGGGFVVKKTGDATVCLIGLPSVGKSTLLNVLTHRETKVAAYEFTTVDAIPGVFYHRGAAIQVIDLPGIISGASVGRGRGREVLSAARNANLILIMTDYSEIETHLDLIHRELWKVGMRLDKKPVKIRIIRTEKGGIGIASPIRLTHLSDEVVKIVLKEYRILNADVTIRGDYTVEELIDILEDNRVYIPSLHIINKIDLVPDEYLTEVIPPSAENSLRVSADLNIGIDELKDIIIDKLQMIKIYMKPQGKMTDFEEPMIIIRGESVGDVCDRIHKIFRLKFRFAKVWGTSAKYEGQTVGINHILEDGDVLSIVRRS